jgi:uncharacterized protein (TIGR00290 family)
MKERIAFSWSGGKDSALALYRLMQHEQYEVAYLLSNFNAENQLSMHAISPNLIQSQSDAIGIPLIKVLVDNNDNASYEKAMEKVLLKLRNEGIFKVGYGDIYLENLKTYREDKLQSMGMKALFPLWQEEPLFLVNQFIELGFKSIVCCVNELTLGADFLDRTIDKKWINALPAGIDPCGENGEFHTFCYDGPLFKQSVSFGIAQSSTKKYRFELSDGTVLNEEYRYSNLVAVG